MKKIRNWLIVNLGLKGSWKWAKRQMLKGFVVGNLEWENDLKVGTNPVYPHRLMATRDEYLLNAKWNFHPHNLADEKLTGYYIVGLRFGNSHDVQQ